MTFRKLSTNFLATLAVGTGAALAQSGPASYCDEGYTIADTNDDGVVSQEELTTATEKEFGDFDRDGDGAISREEYTECRGAWSVDAATDTQGSGEFMKQFDTDADGRVEQAEYAETVETDYYARWADIRGTQPRDTVLQQEETATDASGAGEGATSAEDEKMMTVLRRIVFVPAGATPDFGEMGREEMAARAALRFILLDTNRDRAITEEDWENASTMKNDMSEVLNTEFDAVDADRSGGISREEYSASRQARWDQARQDAQASAESGDGSESDVGAPVVYYHYPQPM